MCIYSNVCKCIQNIYLYLHIRQISVGNLCTCAVMR